MAQTSVQFTPVQVLQAARRAEAEGKMDYALQFYRHLVEQHGTTPEAQEAREGLFRIAEWRWGEARVARGREAADSRAAPQQRSRHRSRPTVHPLAASASTTSPTHPPQQPRSIAPSSRLRRAPAKLPQIISREHRAGEELPPFRPRFQRRQVRRQRAERHRLDHAARRHRRGRRGRRRVLCRAVAIGTARLPFGVLFGVPARRLGLVLVVAGQLACRGVRKHQRAARAGGHRARPHELLSAACLQPPRLFQARHDIDEIAGPMAAVELPLEDAVPRVLAGSRRARQAENIGAVGRAAAGARLDGRRRRRSGTRACGR